jgi:precorrin-6Y C5,15-methyltransferase (decarboxylating)
MIKLFVMGIGYRPLDSRAKDLLLNSEVILASKRLHEVFQRYDEYEAVRERIRVINKIDETISFIRSSLASSNHPSSIILLASGDPLFFGIGRKVLEEFGHDMVEILPDLSSIQPAFAGIKEPWDNAFLMSLHGGPDPEKRRRLPYELKDIPALLRKYDKIAVLTDRQNAPSAIAGELASALSSQQSAVRIFVCERLGYPDEKISSGTPEEIAGMSFGDPNVVILKRVTSLSSFPLVWDPAGPAASSQNDCGQAAMTDNIGFGLTEDKIAHSRGLITKDEVRAVSIHKLRLPRKGVFWDIGAGSGSVSIESAKLYPDLKIFAVEKDNEQIQNLRENRIKFGTLNIKIIDGLAPDVLTDLPVPDRVFIGGSRGRIRAIIDLIAMTQTSIIVINSATVETLNIAVATLRENDFVIDVSQVSVSRMKKLGDGNSFSALNPVFIITGKKTRPFEATVLSEGF